MADTGGILTFLFTDVEGSTALWERSPDAMREAMALHDQLAAQVVERHGGRLVKSRGEGDSLFVVFDRASDALAAAVALQSCYADTHWPGGLVLSARVSVHSGEAHARDGDYYGPTINRAARIRAIGHGGQILVSEAAHRIAERLPEGCRWEDLGVHRLKDLLRAERVFGLCYPGMPSSFPPLASLSRQPHNLPIQLTPFIGRRDSRNALQTLVERHRLVTVIGFGGSGKTRLALQVAAEGIDAFTDGVWMVDLTPVADPTAVVAETASLLGYGSANVQSATDLVQAVGSWRRLLVIDNCEHVLPGVRALVQGLLQSSLDLRVLATSREPLGVPGEAVYRIPTLALPSDEHVADLAVLGRVDSVRLFVDRAQRRRPEFELTLKNAAAVTRIVRHLDGVPLAIEQAAAMVAHLGPADIERRLTDRLRLLDQSSEGLLPRHQTLRATLDGSYELLSDAERPLFQRLSVLSGFSLETAERLATALGMPANDVFPVLQRLVDKSLVVANPGDDGTRYRYLDLIRQYALEKLGEAQSQVWDAWCDAACAWAREADEALLGAESMDWLDRLDEERLNLRTALERLREAKDDRLVQLAHDLRRFWVRRGYLSEGRTWLEAAQARACDDRYAVGIGNALGAICWQQGDLEAAERHYTETLQSAERLNDEATVAAILNNLGILCSDRGLFEEALQHYTRCLPLIRQYRGAGTEVSVMLNMGVSHFSCDRFEDARRVFEETMELATANGDMQQRAVALSNLGDVARCQGNDAECLDFLRRAFEIWREMPSRAYMMDAILELASLAAGHCRWAATSQLLGVYDALARETGANPSPRNRAKLEAARASAESALDDAFRHEWALGRTREPFDVVDAVLEDCASAIPSSA